MNDRQKQTDFLIHCLLYDDSPECHPLVGRVRELQKNERCLQRAVWLMVMPAALALASLGLLAILLEDFPDNVPRFMTGFFAKASCVVALGSSICIVAFASLKVVYRQELDQHREECRQVAAKLLESRLGKPRSVAAEPVTEEPESQLQGTSSKVHRDSRAYQSPSRSGTSPIDSPA